MGNTSGKNSDREWLKRKNEKKAEPNRETLLTGYYKKYEDSAKLERPFDVENGEGPSLSKWEQEQPSRTVNNFRGINRYVEKYPVDLDRGPVGFTDKGRAWQSIISEKAYQKIRDWEGSVSEGGYTGRPTKPENEPDEEAGITIGIGYDLGQRTLEEFTQDWKELLDEKTFKDLAAVVGKKGSNAVPLFSSVAGTKISLDKATQVFRERTVPEFTRKTLRSYPGSENLPPDSLGALVSMVFNRGESVGKPLRKLENEFMSYSEFRKYLAKEDGDAERRKIRAAVQAGEWEAIPSLIKESKRIWENSTNPQHRGLPKRRIEEAQLFQEGLNNAKAELEKRGLR